MSKDKHHFLCRFCKADISLLTCHSCQHNFRSVYENLSKTVYIKTINLPDHLYFKHKSLAVSKMPLLKYRLATALAGYSSILLQHNASVYNM